jgi:hypothetical protein
MKTVRPLPRAIFGALMGCLTNAVAQTDVPAKIPFQRIEANLTLRVRTNEFVVVRTDEEFKTIWEQHARPEVPGTMVPQLPSRPPKVDFSRFFVVAFFGGYSVCEPYRITDVLEFQKRITVNISHRVQGGNCTCTTMFAPSINVVVIQRTDKPLDYAISTENINC